MPTTPAQAAVFRHSRYLTRTQRKNRNRRQRRKLAKQQGAA